VDTYIKAPVVCSDHVIPWVDCISAINRAQELGLFVEGNAQVLWYVFAGSATCIFSFHEEFEQV